jgi:vanillate O-demethylase monooxygenase subunit
MGIVKKSWYVAGWDEEFSAERPLARRLLGQPVVLFRRPDGDVAALLDRCPHRGVALSMGELIEGNLRCRYHGLAFNADGVCVHNPHIAGDPGRLRTGAFATVRRHGAVWIWGGDPKDADPALIPDYHWFDPQNERYAVVHGLYRLQANYRVVMDNLLDLSHAEYLHANTVGTPGSSRNVKTSVSVGPQQVTVHRKVFDLPPSAVFAPLWKQTPHIDQYANMSWRAASNLLLDLGITAPGADEGSGFHFPTAHLLTPESEDTTLYFYAVARNFALDDVPLSKRIEEVFIRAFDGEDRPVIEAVQATLNDTKGTFRFVDFTPGDAAAARARRMLDEILAGEHEPSQAARAA